MFLYMDVLGCGSHWHEIKWKHCNDWAEVDGHIPLLFTCTLAVLVSLHWCLQQWVHLIIFASRTSVHVLSYIPFTDYRCLFFFIPAFVAKVDCWALQDGKRHLCSLIKWHDRRTKLLSFWKKNLADLSMRLFVFLEIHWGGRIKFLAAFPSAKIAELQCSR